MNKTKSNPMYNSFFYGILKLFLSGCLFLFGLSSPCSAQPPNTDSLLQTSTLYQKGKRNTRVGGVLLGIGLAGTLVGAMVSEKESSGRFEIGPSDREVIFLLGGTFGLVGIIKLIQGGSRMQRARAAISEVSYYKAPGQSLQMPALTLRWPVGPPTQRHPVSAFPIPVCF